MRLLHHLCDSLSPGLDWGGARLWLVAMMLVRLALVLMKIGFVCSRPSDLECFDVACSTLHYFSFLVLMTSLFDKLQFVASTSL